MLLLLCCATLSCGCGSIDWYVDSKPLYKDKLLIYLLPGSWIVCHPSVQEPYCVADGAELVLVTTMNNKYLWYCEFINLTSTQFVIHKIALADNVVYIYDMIICTIKWHIHHINHYTAISDAQCMTYSHACDMSHDHHDITCIV